MPSRPTRLGLWLPIEGRIQMSWYGLMEVRQVRMRRLYAERSRGLGTDFCGQGSLESKAGLTKGGFFGHQGSE